MKHSHLTWLSSHMQSCKQMSRCSWPGEVVEWNKRWSPPFPCCPVNCQWLWKKTLIEKNVWKLNYLSSHEEWNDLINFSKKFLQKQSPSSFIEIALRHGCSPVNLLHIFRTLFLGKPLGGCFCHLSSCSSHQDLSHCASSTNQTFVI